MAKKSKGIAFLLVGCILLLIAGGWYLYNVHEDRQAGQHAKAILEQFNTTPPAPVITVEGEPFCGRVIIPKLGVELPVYDQWNYSRLKTAPCRYAGSIATNNMIIAAHNYKSHFGALRQLQPGDKIEFADAYGNRHLYKVCELTTLDGTAVSDMHAGNWDFTLFTCAKGGQQRVTVRCERI